MELNTTKCKVLRVSRTSSFSTTYLLDNSALELVTSYRYLGVHITNTLTWSVHINKIISNANRSLGYLRRNFSSAPVPLKLLLYKTLIRSKLEYAASIWDPSTGVLTSALELVQNNSVRFILGNYSRTASVTSMKDSLELPSLACRRKFSRICLFHKIYYNHTLHDNLILPPSYISSRSDHPQKVGILRCSTHTCYQSFIPRTSQDWNNLPGSITSIVHHSHFHDVLNSSVLLCN